MTERSKGSPAEIIRWGERLFEGHLVSGWGGNLSCRFGRSRCLPLSFEEEYSLDRVPVIPQHTPTVADPAPVAEELRLQPVVIRQGHGTVARGRDLMEAFLITDLLAEAVHCRLVMPDEPKTPA